MTSHLRSKLLAAALALTACGAHAAVQTISSSLEGGFYGPSGYSDHGNGTVGLHEDRIPGGVLAYPYSNRAYLVFDLDAAGPQADPITEATLRIKVTSFRSIAPGLLQNLKWSTVSHDSEPFAVFGVSTPLDLLTAKYGDPVATPSMLVNPAGLAIWNNLAAGPQWGSFTASDDVVGEFVDVQLSAAAIAALNGARGSTITFGLSFIGTRLNGFGGYMGAPLNRQRITIDTRDDGHLLRLVTSPVPEPSAAWLAVPGVLLVLARRKAAGKAAA